MSRMKEHVRQLNEERAVSLPTDFTVTTDAKQSEADAFADKELANYPEEWEFSRRDARFMLRYAYLNGRIDTLREAREAQR